MWKKTAALCLAVCLLLALAACQRARVPGLDWNPEEMVELTVYQTTSYFESTCKTTQDQTLITQTAKALQKMRVKREMRTDDGVEFEGGLTFTFAFTRADSSQEILELLEDTYLYVEAGPFVLATPPYPGVGELWDALPGDPQPVDAAPTPGSYPQAEE